MPEKLPDIITEEEVQMLLAQPNVKCSSGLRNRVILELMVRGGLRVSEVIKLKPGDIRWPSGEVEIHNGKGGRERVVPLTPDTQNWLSLWETQRPRKSGRFFTTLQGRPLLRNYIYGMVRRLADKVGIQEVSHNGDRPKWKVHPHTLRHTYASNLLDGGFTIAEVQQLLGHSNIQTTSIYLHVNPKALREKIQGEAKREAIGELRGEIARLGEKLAALEQGDDTNGLMAVSLSSQGEKMRGEEESGQ